MSGGTVVVGFSSAQSSVTFNGTTYTANANNPTNGVYYYTGTGITAVGGFANKTQLVSVNIQTGVTSVVDNGFSSCTSITSVTFDSDSTLTSIGVNAFYFCTSLTAIILPSGLTYMGDAAFMYCFNLASVNIPPLLTTLNGGTFKSCNLSSLTFDASSSLTSIMGDYTLAESHIASITFPSSVTYFGGGLFYNCFYSLTTVKYLSKENITIIPWRQFEGASLISKVYLYSTNKTGISYFSTNLPSVQIILIDYPCFLEGSKILTNKGYVKIETLRKGDLLQTEIDGCKKIDMIGWREIHHQAVEERKKDQLYKCTPENYPELFEDLVLTGCHSILVDDYKNEEERENTIKVNGNTYTTGNKYRLPACADERALVYETEGHYKVYHVALEHEDYYKNYGIYANGLLVESCSKRYLKELSGMELL